MNVCEAIAAIENEAENIGGEYHYVAMRIGSALDVVRAHVERKVVVTDEMADVALHVWRRADPMMHEPAAMKAAIIAALEVPHGGC